MSADQYRTWVIELLRMDTSARWAAVERQLTKFDFDFTQWLEQLITTVQQSAPQQAGQLQDLLQAIYHLIHTGDYAKAEFDETAPANSKEVVLALARRVKRGELNLDAAAAQAYPMLANLADDDYALDWSELGQSILHSNDEARWVELAELLYRTSAGLPEFATVYTNQALIKTLDAAAMRQRDRHEFETAIATYARAAAIAEATGNADLQMLVTMSMGDVCRLQLPAPNHPDRMLQAERHYRRALEICEQNDLALIQRASVLLELGKTLTNQGSIREGIGYIEQYLLIYRAQRDLEPTKLLYALVILASAHSDIGEYNTASLYYREALDWAPNDEYRVELLGSLNYALSYFDDVGAGDVTAEAVRLADQVGKDELRISAYSNLGYYRARRGDLQGALDAYHVARAAAAAIHNESSEARWLNALAQIYTVLGQLDAADDAIRQVDKIHLRLEDTDASAHNAASRSQLRLQSGDLIGAAINAAVAFQRYHQARRPSDMGLAANMLAKVYLRMGDLECAEQCLHYNLAKAQRSGTIRSQCYALGGLANIQARRNLLDEAAQAYGQAITMAETIGELRQAAEFHEARGQVLERQPNRLDEAEREYRRAVELAEAQRSGFRSTERRIQIQDEDPYIRLVALLARQHDNPASLGQALSFAERARSRTLSELLSRTDLLHPATLARPLADREKELLAQLRRIEETDESGVEVAERHAQLNRELEALWYEMEQIDDDCRDYVDLRRTPILSVEDIRHLLAA